MTAEICDSRNLRQKSVTEICQGNQESIITRSAPQYGCVFPSAKPGMQAMEALRPMALTFLILISFMLGFIHLLLRLLLSLCWHVVHHVMDLWLS